MPTAEPPRGTPGISAEERASRNRRRDRRPRTTAAAPRRDRNDVAREEELASSSPLRIQTAAAARGRTDEGGSPVTVLSPLQSPASPAAEDDDAATRAPSSPLVWLGDGGRLVLVGLTLQGGSAEQGGAVRLGRGSLLAARVTVSTRATRRTRYRGVVRRRPDPHSRATSISLSLP